MADYYPLLAKAVSALPDSTAAARRAIYERARKALLGQLRAINPPIADADLARENNALDEAVARLESEIAAKHSLQAAESALVSGPSETGAAPPKMTMPPRTQSSFQESQDAIEAAEASEAEPISDLKMPRQRETQRPAAPTPSDKGANGKRLWILGGVIAGVVLLVASLAIKLRDQSGGDLSQLKAPTTSSSEPAQGGKNTGRVGGTKNDAAPSVDNSSAASPGARSTASQSQQGPIPVAYRAALLMQAPRDGEETKTFIGSVVWRLDNVPSGPGQPLGTAIHADIDIPDAKMRMTLEIQKNVDRSLAASHIAEIRFSLLAGSELPGIKLIRPFQMRREEPAAVDPLAGEAVAITENYYLVALSRGDLEIRNMDLMKSRGWVDLPIGLTNGRIAKLTLEKGTSGERVFNDAMSVWAQQK